MDLISEKLNNLPRKLVFATVIWLLISLLFVGLAVNITWKLEDRGKAINEAGSLRKQSYLLTVTALNEDQTQFAQEAHNFKQSLEHLRGLDLDLWWRANDREDYLKQIEQIQANFQDFQQDLLTRQHDDLSDTAQSMRHTAQFAAQIDSLVTDLEQQNTHNIQVMRIAQILLVLLIFFSAFLILYLLNYLVMRPISLVTEGLNRITSGHLDTRLDIRSNDEFSEISEGFNKMASSLEELYQHLEDKVIQKTIDLEEMNYKLSTLYNMSDYLHKSTMSDHVLHTFLDKMMKLSNAAAGSIRLLNQEGSSLSNMFNINVPESLIENESCSKISGCLCGSVFEADDRLVDLTYENKLSLCAKIGFHHLLVFHIRLREETFGVLTLFFEHERLTDQTHQSLIPLLCVQLATAIENHRLAQKEMQYAVLDERNIMAQGLHDSIAQSLSYMNMQLQMTQKALTAQDVAKIEQHLLFLNTGLQQCYEDVRELLNNFRLKLTQDSFQDALMSVIERFSSMCKIVVDVDYQSNGHDLTTEQQLQLLFITQEALSNIRKHAAATRVTVTFLHTDHIQLTIADNGVGFDFIPHYSHETNGHHIGLSIMQERINKVGGHLTIESVRKQGTQIQVII